MSKVGIPGADVGLAVERSHEPARSTIDRAVAKLIGFLAKD